MLARIRLHYWAHRCSQRFQPGVEIRTWCWVLVIRHSILTQDEGRRQAQHQHKINCHRANSIGPGKSIFGAHCTMIAEITQRKTSAEPSTMAYYHRCFMLHQHMSSHLWTLFRSESEHNARFLQESQRNAAVQNLHKTIHQFILKNKKNWFLFSFQ